MYFIFWDNVKCPRLGAIQPSLISTHGILPEHGKQHNLIMFIVFYD